MVSDVRSSGHESNFDVQCLVYYYHSLIEILAINTYSICLIVPPYSSQFLLYAAYNAIADPFGGRIPQRGDRVLTSFVLYFFFAPAKSDIRRRHRRSLQGNRFFGDHPDLLYTYYNGDTWIWFSFPSLFFLSTASGCSSGFVLIVNGLLGQKNHTHF